MSISSGRKCGYERGSSASGVRCNAATGTVTSRHSGVRRTSAPQALPIPDLDNFGLGGALSSLAARKAALNDMYNLVAEPLRSAALNSHLTSDLLDQINFAGYVPAGGAVYPNDDFGKSLKSTAALIKADVGVEAVAVDIDGWDTHIQQGVAPG